MLTENSLNLLEFNKLLRIISGFANSEATEKSVLGIWPFDNREEIRKRLGQVQEIRRMSQEGDALRLSRFSDISKLLAKVRPEGSVLDGPELSGFIPVLGIIAELSLQLGQTENTPFLKGLTDRLTGFPKVMRILKKALDSEGHILDTASALLSELRGRIRRQEGRIRKKLEELVRDERVSLFLQDDFITTRSGRWVIPVRMDSKGQVNGVVHDVSRSGETAFVEPVAIISLANELENLVAGQKSEELRILREICSRIRDESDEIEVQYEIVVYLDTLNCIALFADRMRMETPQINDSGTISISNARHPLLVLALLKSKGGPQAVPLEVRLGEDDRVMVITGSNAGGKTIAIKTIGLLQIMALSGMPVTADSSSSFPLVHHLLVDMGDEQSIENSLSTFSAHVSNISGILKKADSRTLVLVDELGTGTDPDEGAALACAVLKELKARNSLVFATTHLTDIKGFVHRTEGMLNASMEFDQKTLTPLYRLRTGEPGQSHAIEIAKKYGLPESIIESAKGMLGGVRIELDNMIADLNSKRAGYEKALNELQREKTEIEERNRRLAGLLAETESRQKEILSNAYKEASGIISDIKRQLHSLLKEAKEKGRETTRKAVKEAEARQAEISQKLRGYDRDDEGAPPIDRILEGDVVYVRSLGHDAPVVEVNLKHNRLKVRSGSMEVEVPVSDIGFKRGKSNSGDTILNSQAIKYGVPGINTRINLVGLRVDEALSRLEPFLNHASLAGFSEVTIIHGIGKGLLKKAVHEHLDRHPLIRHFRSGGSSEGGAGVTVVTLL